MSIHLALGPTPTKVPKALGSSQGSDRACAYYTMHDLGLRNGIKAQRVYSCIPVHFKGYPSLVIRASFSTGVYILLRLYQEISL